MIVAVDTNVLLDILIPGAPDQAASRKLLETALTGGPLVVCEAVYAELGVRFADRALLDRFLGEVGIGLLPSTADALKAAAEAHGRYLARRPAVRCPSCKARLPGRARILADFMIGGHALEQADALLSRDRGFYRKYFRSLRMLK